MSPGSWDYWAEIGQGFVDAVVLLVTGDPETWAIIRQSLLISISATLASMVLGVPLGAWLAHTRFPDQVPGRLPDGLAIGEADGNFVILDIGGGAYALYAHLQPGSVRVSAGERVRRGDQIGTVGNS